jgi:hypothetical protein
MHVVFTLPHALLPLTYRNGARLYTWLFQISAATLREVAADPRLLGAEIGVLSILHTWGQTLVRHPHVHCVIPAGGLSPDHQRWIHPKHAGFFLPVKVLSRVFRGKFVEQLRRAYTRGQLELSGATEHLRGPAQWHAFIDALFQTDWVVYAKPAFGGASAVLRYLGRYTHRVAISNHWLRAFDGERVTFQWKDYARANQSRSMTVVGDGVSAALRPAHSATRVRPHSAVGLSREYLPDHPRRPVAHPLECGAPYRRDPVDGDRDADVRHVGLSALRRRDDPRPNPFRAPTAHDHPRLR